MLSPSCITYKLFYFDAVIRHLVYVILYFVGIYQMLFQCTTSLTLEGVSLLIENVIECFECVLSKNFLN